MNLREHFEVAIRRAPQAIAIVDPEIRWTYEELAREAIRYANSFWSLGLRAGDRIMVLLRNRREHIVIFWASQLLGLVYVPVGYRLSSNDIAYCIEDAEPEMLVFDEMSSTIIHELAARKALPRAVYAVGEQTTTTFANLAKLTATSAQMLHSIPIPDDAIAVMLYSSGVTGVPKGIPRSHTNEVSATLAHIVQNGYQFGESTLALSSFSHTMGLRVLLAMALLNGKLYASKLIMRHGQAAEKPPSPCQVQTGYRCDEEPRQESAPMSENASPDLRVKGRTCYDDGYA